MGTIGYDELEDAMCFLGFDAPRQEVIDLIEEYDPDHARIEYLDFLEIMT